MPTTFNVISLGNFASIDPTEGNTQAENASSLVGLTFGGVGNALVNNMQSMSPTGSGFGGGTSTAYDMNNNASNDQFSLDGGPAQTFDGTSVYNATITYIDGTTATISAVIFQDTAGNTYMAPEYSANADQAVLEANPMRSLTLNSLAGNNYSGLNGTRQSFSFVTCFTTGMRLMTPTGMVEVEKLQEGDLLMTRDNGFQRIRWVGKATRAALGKLAPIRIAKGALGLGLPVRDLIVSQQHRMLIVSEIARRIIGEGEALVPAKKLLHLPGIDYADDMITVTYYHVLLDRHEVIFAEGAPTESLLIGAMAERALGEEAYTEIAELFPDLLETASTPARPLPDGPKTRKLIARHMKNIKPLLNA